MSHHPRGKVVNFIQEFSIPLIAGVFVAVVFANVNNHVYHGLVHKPLYELHTVFDDAHHGEAHSEKAHQGEQDSHAAKEHHSDDHHGEEHIAGKAESGDHGGLAHFLALHFLVNDIFMVIFFGIAAKEITEACLPGGALNPVSKAINPLLGTLGGVLGPVGVFFALNAVIGTAAWSNGWGIPTATDIALAWLVARLVFGAGHPAVSFLLLLAVADDAIGLGIIAIAYPDPLNPTVWANALLILPAMGIAYGMRRMKIKVWWPYVFIAGALSWYGLFSAHLHPALALVFIVPFIPGPNVDLGLYTGDDSDDDHHAHSPLEQFEHDNKLFVDFGLFFFAFANAGVPFADVNNLTWIILGALAIGKTVGITFFSYLGVILGFPLPERMGLKELSLAGLVAGIGLTVALFVAGQAYTDVGAQGAAKMGALLSGGITFLAIFLGKVMRVKDEPLMNPAPERSADELNGYDTSPPPPV